MRPIVVIRRSVVTVSCFECFQIVFSNSVGELRVDKSVEGLQMRGFGQYLPIVIGLLFLATGNYIIFVRDLRFFLRL